MAFDNPTRNRLASFVAACRNLLSDEFTGQLKRDYGLDPDSGVVTDIDKLTQLDDAHLETARILRDTLQHYVAGAMAEPKKARQEAMKRIVREQAFTVLNRLCALRMAEARKLFVESVGNGLQSQGFQLYARLAGTALGESSDAYRCYLFSVFDELAVDLAVLFNRFSPEGRLFPSGTVLQDILSKLNASEIVPLWEEDETIGWIYQYFNDPAERKKMRDESSAPRNSRELAVRNQFFTPRYVVEFLTDNTLGRIWYEMTQGQTSLKDTCRYMVRRPDEVFLGEQSTEALDAEIWAVQPVASPRRAEKSAAKKKATSTRTATEAITAPAIPPVRTVADLLLVGTEETFPEFSVATDQHIQRMIDFAHCVSGYMRRPNAEQSWEWLQAFQRQHLDSMHHDGVSTQDILDALFLTCRNDRHGGDGTVYKEPWFAAACNEVRRRILNSRRTDLSQEELLKQPVFIPYRALKDPREIRMLDPACGSMHFGLYAFDLFEIIYSEYTEFARQKAEYGDSAATAYCRLRTADYPKLIIEHNIHGIDIDRRAVQIAGLSLWLRAQKSWQKQKVKPQDRPRIVRSNIVCAEPMPGNSELLEEFLQKHLSSDAESQLLTVLVRKVFEAMKLAGEAGSLLKIEEEIAGEVEKARQLWEKSREKKQQSLFDNRQKQVQQEMDFVRKIDDATFWDEAENLIYAALRAYAEQAENGGGFQRRLFAEDAARGFAFIDVCRKNYDAVVMNPPFGEPTNETLTALKAIDKKTSADLSACFLQRAAEMSTNNGAIGAISTRSIFFLSNYADWRREQFLDANRIRTFLDLGEGVLDAQVETAAYVVESRSRHTSFSFFNFNSKGRSQSTAADLPEVIAGATCGRVAENSEIVFHSEVASIPEQVFACSLPTSVRSLFSVLRPYSESGGIVKQGLGTSDDFRFVRLAWELSDRGETWFPYAKGGSSLGFYSDIHLLVNFQDNGRELWNNKTAAGNVRSNIWMLEETIAEYFFNPGLTFTYRSSRFAPEVMPRGTIFGVTGMCIFPYDRSANQLLLTLGLFNSSIVNFMILETCESHRPLFQASKINRTPWVSVEANDIISAAVWQIIGRLQSFLRNVEPSCLYTGLGNMPGASLKTSELNIASQRSRCEIELRAVLSRIDHEAFQIYDISLTAREIVRKEILIRRGENELPGYEDVAGSTASYCLGVGFGRWDVRYATGGQAAPELPDPFAPLPVCPPGQLQNAQGMPAGPKDVPENYPIQIPWDGILVDDPGHALDIERRVRDVIEIIWGSGVGSRQLAVGSEDKKQEEATAETADSARATPEAIEQEACEILGVKSLREYFQKPTKFFADHLKRYSKSRRQAPIYWPLSTESGGYTLWIYYHRLTDQTLFHAVNNFVEPKLKQVTEDVARLKGKSSRSTAEENDLSKLTELESELTDFRDELLRIAKFWKPNLNDGVLITASPLWKLFRLPKWRKDLKACWEELEKGDYDWAHLALTAWPDRVVRTAHKDRSIAIAHDLETELWHEVTVTKPGRGKNAKPTTKTEWQPKKLSEAELDRIVQQVKRRQ